MPYESSKLSEKTLVISLFPVLSQFLIGTFYVGLDRLLGRCWLIISLILVVYTKCSALVNYFTGTSSNAVFFFFSKFLIPKCDNPARDSLSKI